MFCIMHLHILYHVDFVSVIACTVEDCATCEASLTLCDDCEDGYFMAIDRSACTGM